MRLIDAPVGLFMYDGVMGFKTEYMTNGFVEAFVVESGEYFWGGVKTSEERNNLEVTPIEVEPVRHGEWISFDDVLSFSIVIACSVCGSSSEIPKSLLLDKFSVEFYNYCPNCGAKMDGKKAEEKE